MTTTPLRPMHSPLDERHTKPLDGGMGDPRQRSAWELRSQAAFERFLLTEMAKLQETIAQAEAERLQREVDVLRAEAASRSKDRSMRPAQAAPGQAKRVAQQEAEAERVAALRATDAQRHAERAAEAERARESAAAQSAARRARQAETLRLATERATAERAEKEALSEEEELAIEEQRRRNQTT